MTTLVEDRRVRRSKALIVRAFADLAVEKDYGRLTVQDIIDRADVGRSTFYAHFRDKQAVLLSCFDEVETGLAVLADSPSSTNSAAANVVLNHAWEYQRVYRAVCASSASGLVQRHLRQLLLPFLDRSFPQDTRPGERVIAREFYVSALIGLLTWWVTTGFRIDPDELAADFQLLAARGIPGLKA